MTYTFKQYGTLTIGIFVGSMILIYLAYYNHTGDDINAFTLVLMESLLALAFLLFYCLTIEVGEQAIVLKFGIGLIRKTIRIEDINHTACVRNKWWYGFGIRLTPHGWMWNISGLDAVEIRYKNSNKRFRMGTDDCQKLKREIDKRIERLAKK